MDEGIQNALLENDREWRRYMIEKIEELHKEMMMLKAWSLVFRLAGTAAFTILLVLFETNRH